MRFCLCPTGRLLTSQLECRPQREPSSAEKKNETRKEINNVQKDRERKHTCSFAITAKRMQGEMKDSREKE